ncbi:hypothetical protein KUTeg_006709 [Tegillarca granosa]|uniref:Uncharacterized protein n=1 Tax=Tegillarca granosa TaxID=220873 RepID=A0ABQ9FB31_TEGGR|nr:hypothetical protein KUTeg_006709 [Tegillarca granosa]
MVGNPVDHEVIQCILFVNLPTKLEKMAVANHMVELLPKSGMVELLPKSGVFLYPKDIKVASRKKSGCGHCSAFNELDSRKLREQLLHWNINTSPSVSSSVLRKLYSENVNFRTLGSSQSEEGGANQSNNLDAQRVGRTNFVNTALSYSEIYSGDTRQVKQELGTQENSRTRKDFISPRSATGLDQATTTPMDMGRRSSANKDCC